MTRPKVEISCSSWKQERETVLAVVVVVVAAATAATVAVAVVAAAAEAAVGGRVLDDGKSCLCSCLVFPQLSYAVSPLLGLVAGERREMTKWSYIILSETNIHKWDFLLLFGGLLRAHAYVEWKNRNESNFWFFRNLVQGSSLFLSFSPTIRLFAMSNRNNVSTTSLGTATSLFLGYDGRAHPVPLVWLTFCFLCLWTQVNIQFFTQTNTLCCF